MTELHIGVEDSRGLKIPGSRVSVTDRTTGSLVGANTADSDGVADISFLGTPFGNYHMEAVTPQGHRDSGDFSLDWLGNPPSLVIRVQSSTEGSASASAVAWWTNLGKWGQIALVGGAGLVLVVIIVAARPSRAPIVVIGKPGGG